MEDSLSGVEPSLSEPVHNGVDEQAKLQDQTAALAEPLAMRLVEEAVEEAVEKVSRMTRKQIEDDEASKSELEKADIIDVDDKGEIETLEVREIVDETAQTERAFHPAAGEEMQAANSGDREITEPSTPGVEETARGEEAPSVEPEKAEDEYMDVLGNGCLKKKTLVPGKGRESRPLHGDTVTVSYVASLVDTGAEVISEEVTFVVGDGDVMQALDLGIALTELHEEFELITAPKFAFGSIGLEGKVPPDASLSIRGKLVRTDEPPTYDTMSWSRILTSANDKRERGNFLYERNEFALSINSYGKALEILNSRRQAVEADEGGGEKFEEYEAELTATKVKIYNNMAAAQIRVEAYEAAVTSCDDVLRLSPDNVKAWFRRGKAKAGKGEYSEAVRSLRNALEHDPESRIVQNELKRVLALIKSERESQQRIYRRMFGAAQADGGSAEEGARDAGWRRYVWYGAGVAALGMSVALASAAFKYHQQT